MSRPRRPTSASGCLSRFAVHAGWSVRPKSLPASTNVPPSSGMQASGVRRGRPLRAPVAVSASPGGIRALSSTCRGSPGARTGPPPGRHAVRPWRTPGSTAPSARRSTTGSCHRPSAGRGRGRGGGSRGEEARALGRVGPQRVHGAEERRVGGGPLHVPVRVVLPYAADAAVRLDGLPPRGAQRLEALREGERCRDLGVRRLLRGAPDGPGGVAGGRAGGRAGGLDRTYRSARRCLTAWKDPTGRPNCSLTPTYSRVPASAREAAPTASAASAAAARTPVRASAVRGSPASCPPRGSAGTSRSSTRARGRVSSRAVSRLRTRPFASPGTRKSRMPLRA